MSRLGKTTKNAQIYSYALGRYEHEFEMEQIGNRTPKPYGLTARQRISENGTNQPIIFGTTDSPTYSLQDTSKYMRKKLPMTEYQEKIGIRSNSSLYEMAHDKPYVEVADEGLHGDIHGQAPSIDLLTPNEIYKLTTVSKPSMVKPLSSQELVKEKMAKLDQPYKVEELSRDNTDVKAYIANNLGETQLYPSQEPSHGDGGSNLKFDYKKEMNRGTQPISAKDLYNQTYNSRRAVSGINFAQRDALKAKELLNTYYKQSENRPTPVDVKPQSDGSRTSLSRAPSHIEEQKQEAKEQEEVMQKKQGNRPQNAGSIVQQAVGAVGDIVMGGNPVDVAMKIGEKALEGLKLQ
jgi:hypothetical protein